jgi:hypothetical protein
MELNYWYYSPFVGYWLLFSFLILYTVGRIPRMVDQHNTTGKQDNTNRIIATHRHPILERDSNTRPQHSNGQRQFMPRTSMPSLSSVLILSYHLRLSLECGLVSTVFLTCVLKVMYQYIKEY